MHIMYPITDEQQNLLAGKTFNGGSFFSPVRDIYGKFAISEQEVLDCTNEDVKGWVSLLQPVEGEYISNYPYYMDFKVDSNNLDIYTSTMYPIVAFTSNLDDLSQEDKDVMYALKTLIEVDYDDLTRVEFIRKDSLVKIHSDSAGIVSLLLEDIDATLLVSYEAVGAVCVKLVKSI